MVKIISKNLINTVLDIHENAENYDKKEVLLTLLDEDRNNSYIIDELESMGYCECGNKYIAKNNREIHEVHGGIAYEIQTYYECESCGSKSY